MALGPKGHRLVVLQQKRPSACSIEETLWLWPLLQRGQANGLVVLQQNQSSVRRRRQVLRRHCGYGVCSRETRGISWCSCKQRGL